MTEHIIRRFANWRDRHNMWFTPLLTLPTCISPSQCCQQCKNHIDNNVPRQGSLLQAAPERRYKDDKLPAQVFLQLAPLVSCTNKPIMDAEFCSLDDHRSAGEISLKLAVVHFTTMTAYCHLLSMRGEPTKVICRKMVIFFIFPGYIIIYHAMAILAILGAFLLVRFRKLQDSALLQTSLKRAPFILFGAINQQSSQPKVNISNGESVAKIIGRIMVVLALSAQCIGSCIIFARRHQHDAITIADWRVLELAIAALFISLLTVVHVLWHPDLRLNLDETFEQAQKGHLTYLDKILLHFLGVAAPVDSGSSKDERTKWLRRAIGVYFDAPTTVAAYWAQPLEARKRTNSLLNLFSSGGLLKNLHIIPHKSTFCDQGASTRQCSSAGKLGFKILASVNQILFFTISIMYTAVLLRVISAKVFRARWKAVRWWRILLQVLILVPGGVLTWALVSFLSIVALLGVGFPLWIVFMFFFHMPVLVFELIVLAYWPTELACSLLWSDPNANFLWHLM